MTPDYLSEDDFVSSRRSQRLAALESEIDTAILPSLKPWHWGVAAGVVLAVVGVLWLVNSKAGSGGIPTIQADARPFKVKPEKPGGTEVPFQEMQVYDALPGSASPEAIKKQDVVDKIQPPPEEPVERPGNSKSTRIVTADAAKTTVTAETESLFDTSEADEMPPPAGQQVAAIPEASVQNAPQTAAEENLSGFVAEMDKAEALTRDGAIAGLAPDAASAAADEDMPAQPEKLLPSDMVDAEPRSESLLSAVPEKTTKTDSKQLDKPKAQAAPLSLKETAKKDAAAVMPKDTVKNLATGKNITPPQVEKSDAPVQTKLAAAELDEDLPSTSKKVPFVEGHPIKATGATSKSANGNDVIEIRSPDREKPVDIRSAQSPKKLVISSEAVKEPSKEAAKTAPKPVKVASVAPAVPTKTKAAGGGWRVQIAAVPEQSLAMSEWKRYKARHSDLLGKLDVRVQQVDLGAKGIFYRVQGGVLDRPGADSTCAGLRQRGVSCLVVRD